MEKLRFSADYITMLRSAMCRPEARAFALSRLEISLGSIGIDPICRREILQFLMTFIRDGEIYEYELVSAILNFERRWRTHLDRVYLRDYESTRWEFAQRFVFSKLPSSLGRCLDVGCGRGCITASIVQHGIAEEAVGIDETDFSNEWRERLANSHTTANFQHIKVDNITRWALTNRRRFDAIILFYVLHHSIDYWVSKTLHSLLLLLKNDGVLVVLEDAFVEGVPPTEDNNRLYPQWENWTNMTQSYYLSVGYDIQVIMDFVAVQLLAGFKDVKMPCNYKTSKEWIRQFSCLGYDVSSVENIGFPAHRDIDVPQALFVLKKQGF